MAIRYAVANGNWSSTATWDGGTLPASGDDVYSNGFAVSINQTITVNSLKKIANTDPAIVVGGSFTVTTSATVTITAGIQSADGVSTNLGVLTINGVNTVVTVNSPTINGGTTLQRHGIHILAAHTGVVNINGSALGGIAGSGGCYAVYNLANTTINFTGNITGGSGANAIAFTNSGNLVLNVTGNISGGTPNNAAYGFNDTSTTGLTLTLNGNAIANTEAAIVSVCPTANITVNGYLQAGNTTGAAGVFSSGNFAVTTINGNILGGGVFGVSMGGSNPILTVTGTVYGPIGNGANTITMPGINAICTINGTVIGGTGPSSTGVGVQLNGANSHLYVNGEVRGGTGTSTFGITTTGGEVLIRGTVRPGNGNGAGCIAVNATGAGAPRISGDIYGGGMVANTGQPGFFPIQGSWGGIKGENVNLHLYTAPTGPTGLGTPITPLSKYGSNLPTVDKVRGGVTYGPSGSLTGTLEQLQFTLEDIAAVTGAQIAAGMNFAGPPLSVTHKLEMRDSTSGNYSYVGNAPVGTLDSATGWDITRITLNASPVVTMKATGSWDNRASLTYT